MSDTEAPTTITEHEAGEVARANATGLQPVVFIHGLWLLPSSWDRWATLFEEAGFTGAHARLARRSRDRRGGQRASRGVREQDASARSPITSTRSSAASRRSRS